MSYDENVDDIGSSFAGGTENFDDIFNQQGQIGDTTPNSNDDSAYDAYAALTASTQSPDNSTSQQFNDSNILDTIESPTMPSPPQPLSSEQPQQNGGDTIPSDDISPGDEFNSAIDIVLDTDDTQQQQQQHSHYQQQQQQQQQHQYDTNISLQANNKVSDILPPPEYDPSIDLTSSLDTPSSLHTHTTTPPGGSGGNGGSTFQRVSSLMNGNNGTDNTNMLAASHIAFNQNSIEPVPSPPPYNAPKPVVDLQNMSFAINDPFAYTPPGTTSTVYYYPVTVSLYYLRLSSEALPTIHNNDHISSQYPHGTIDYTTSTHNIYDDSYNTNINAISSEQYKIYEYTVFHRFSDFDQLYKSINTLYPTLPPFPSKLNLDSDATSILAHKRRVLLQDLINRLFSLDFVVYLSDWQSFFYLPMYASLPHCPAPLVPFITSLRGGRLGDLETNQLNWRINGTGANSIPLSTSGKPSIKVLSTAPSPQQQQQQQASASSSLLSSSSSQPSTISQSIDLQTGFGFNCTYYIPNANILLTGITWNNILTRKLNTFTSWFTKTPLSSVCSHDKAYGAIIAWGIDDETSAWTVLSVIYLDTSVTTLTAERTISSSSSSSVGSSQQGTRGTSSSSSNTGSTANSSNSSGGSAYTVYAGLANGQICRLGWSDWSLSPQLIEVRQVHDVSTSIVQIFIVENRLISIARDGIIAVDSLSTYQPTTMINLAGDILSVLDTLLHDDYIIIGMANGALAVFYISRLSSGRDPHYNVVPMTPSVVSTHQIPSHPHYQPSPGSEQPTVNLSTPMSNISDGYSHGMHRQVSNGQSALSLYLVSFTQPHSDGIRFISSTSHVPYATVSQYYSANYKYAYFKALEATTRGRAIGHNNTTNQTSSSSNWFDTPHSSTSNRYDVHARMAAEDNDTFKGFSALLATSTDDDAMMLSPSPRISNTHHTPSTSSTSSPVSPQAVPTVSTTTTLLLTASHDGTNMLLDFNPHHPLLITPLTTLKAGQSQCALICGNIQYDPILVTSHMNIGVASKVNPHNLPRLVLWHLSDLESGPFFIIPNAHTDQVVSLSYDSSRSRIISIARDGFLKSWNVGYLLNKQPHI